MTGMHVFLFSTEKKKKKICNQNLQQNAVYLQLFLPYSLLKETNFFLFFFFLKVSGEKQRIRESRQSLPQICGINHYRFQLALEIAFSFVSNWVEQLR